MSFEGFLAIRPSAVSDLRVAEQQNRNQMRAPDKRKRKDIELAVLPLIGPMSRNGDWMYGTATAVLGQQLRMAAVRPNFDAIVIPVDSPGGNVDGTPELAEDIRFAASRKPVIACIEGGAHSAAAWSISGATTIYIAPSSACGSIGVLWAHLDASEANKQAGLNVTMIQSTQSPFKSEANPYQPLSVEARQHHQEQCDTLCDEFIRTLARNRNQSREHVARNFGRGRSLDAKQAKAVGLVDAIGTFDRTISRLLAGDLPSIRQRAASNNLSHLIARNRARRAQRLQATWAEPTEGAVRRRLRELAG